MGQTPIMYTITCPVRTVGVRERTVAVWSHIFIVAGFRGSMNNRLHIINSSRGIVLMFAFEMCGAHVGCSVGCSVGATGLAVGFSLGSSEGSSVGSSVGNSEFAHTIVIFFVVDCKSAVIYSHVIGVRVSNRSLVTLGSVPNTRT